MDTILTANEARVIGCLLEKEKTTPDQYPLSLNGLTNACNQKSNREPVMNLSESEVQETLDGLVKKHLASEKTGFGSRVLKYHHRFFNSEFGGTKFSHHLGNQQKLNNFQFQQQIEYLHLLQLFGK